MSKVSFTDIQRDFIEKAKKTADLFPELVFICESSLACMWHMKREWENIMMTKWGERELPPMQKWVSIYFFRNMTYLRAAYILAREGSCSASRDLQRTIAETIWRGYLFIVDEKEARLYASLIEGTIKPEDRQTLKKRKYYPFDFLLKRLYKPKTRKSFYELFSDLSRFSHPSIIGIFTELQYPKSQTEDCLKVILALIYGNTQMLAEGFLELLDAPIKETVKNALKTIASYLHEHPLFEPDKEDVISKIRLRNGNFLMVL